MSGGSLQYIYLKIDSIAGEIKRVSQKPLHIAFAKHLEKVSKALHDLEWVYSSDYSSPAEEEAIRAVLHPSAELESAKEEAERVLLDLTMAIKEAEKKI